MILPNSNTPWATINPRAWQRQALPVALAALAQPRDKGAIVQAVMGAGKSVLCAEIIRCVHTQNTTCVVVAPKKLLVRQLQNTIGLQLRGVHVGAWYSGAKDANAPVVVTTVASLARLVGALARPVGLLIFDEAHRSETAQVLDCVKALQPAAVLGFTATPWRSKARERLSLFDEVIVSYDFASAIADGVLVPYQIITWSAPRAAASGVDSDDINAVCLAMLANAKGPGIVSANNVDDAKAWAAIATAAGYRCAVLHGGTKDAARDNMLRQLERGKLHHIVHINVLAEGADLPYLRWLCLRRSASSKIRYPQEIGRVLRSHPGKTRAIVYDPHALSMVRSLAEHAVLWRPAKIVAWTPPGTEHRRRLERWLSSRDYTSIVNVDGDFNDLYNTVVSRKIKSVVVFDGQALTGEQRQWLGSASADWGSDRAVRIYQVVPTPPGAAVVVVLDSNDRVGIDAQRVAIGAWVKRLGKVVVGVLDSGAAPQLAAAQAHPWGLPPNHGAHVSFDAVVVLNKRCLRAPFASWLRGWGRRVSEVSPDRVTAAALVLGGDEALIHEARVWLESQGHLDPGPRLPLYVRDRAQSPAQAEYLDRLKHSVRGWAHPAPVSVLDRLRGLVVAGLQGRLTLGTASDLIGTLKGCQAAGGWTMTVD